MWQEIEIPTHRRVEVIDITEQVLQACRAAGHSSGLVVVTSNHTTAGICVNEAELRLWKDLEGWLERLAPAGDPYTHNTIDDNADAHLRAVLLGHAACVPFEGGALALGTWQRILLVELDGPRRRRLKVGVVG